MQAFARLLDSLSFQPARNAKLRLIETYLRETPDPDRGWALAALTGGLDFPAAKPALLRSFGAGEDRPGAVPSLLRLCRRSGRDAGADLGDEARRRAAADLSEVVETLQRATKTQTPAILKRWLDALDSTGRWALLKLLTGALRIGVSARLAKQAVANIGSQPVGRGRGGLARPRRALSAAVRLADGRRAEARIATWAARSCSPMLANPIDRAEIDALDPAHFRAEWKWDGIRVQIAVLRRREAALSAAPARISRAPSPTSSTRSISRACSTASCWCAASEAIAPFNDLQQRLNRKTVTAKMLKEHPAHVRLYDVLWLEGEDLRALLVRRAPRAGWRPGWREQPRARFDVSPLVRVHRLGRTSPRCARRCGRTASKG